jgi:hypothetical protein
MKKLIVVLSLFSSYAYASKNIDLKKAQNMMQKSTWAFEENKGQVTGADGKNVKFVFKDGNLSMFLMQTGIAYQFHKVTYPEGYKPLDKFASMEEHEKMEKLQSQIQTETYRMDVILEGANPNPKIKTEGKSSDYIQYYNHNALDVRSYQKVTYYEVYPHIDWVVYVNKNAGDNEPKVKYDFVVHPGGDPSQIKLKTEWVEELTSNEDGSLTMKNRMGSITEQRPVSFQDGKDVKTNFIIDKSTLSFLLENFDKSKDMVIDPGLSWATYYGGSGFDKGISCAVDIDKNVYLAGITNSTSGIASGGHRATFGLGEDAFLVKFNSAGVRQWATYYGSTVSWGEIPISCAVDSYGNVYLAGNTNSTSGIASGGHQNSFGGNSTDLFLVKFNSAGARLWATYYGGWGLEHEVSCAVDNFGNVYLAGMIDRFTTGIAAGGHQDTFGGMLDLFLVKFNYAGTREWATYYGGLGAEENPSCAVDGNGNVYLAGTTSSTSGIASGGHQNTHGGGSNGFYIMDAFLVKFNSTGVRQWATYYGGSSVDVSQSCAVDGSGNVYLAGGTNSTGDIASGGHQNTHGGGSNGWYITDAFLVKFNSVGVRQWGTYYGGSSPDGSYSCAVDVSGNTYLAGITESTSGIASGGHQNTTGGSSDAFLVKFNSAGVRQWGTYYGGSSPDGSYSCAVDVSGNAYLAGITESTSGIAFGGYQDTFRGNRDAFLVKLLVNCYSTSSTFTTAACDSYYWAAKNKTYTTSNNTDTVRLINASGCDSIVTLNLTIKNATSSTFTTAACGSYYWAAKNKTYTTSNNTDTLRLINASGCDSIVTLNLIIIGTSSTFTAAACGSYFWSAKNKTYTGSIADTAKYVKTYSYSFDHVSCDSIVTLNLTIYPNPIPTIIKTGNVLITQSYNSYQWLLNGVNIIGATNQSYAVAVSGNYQVAVTDTNNCSGASSIGAVIVSSLNEAEKDYFKIYPNPSEKMLHIETNASGNWQAIITDVKGSQINQMHFNKSTQLDISNYAPGVYYIQLTGKENVLSYKFIKK